MIDRRRSVYGKVVRDATLLAVKMEEKGYESRNPSDLQKLEKTRKLILP